MASAYQEPVAKLRHVVAAVAARVAPTWPLQRSIAVNPWWEFRDQAIETVAAEMQASHPLSMLMPSGYFKQQFNQQKITVQHLEAAFAEQLPEQTWGTDTYQQLLDALNEAPEFERWLPLTDLFDDANPRRGALTWHDEMVHQVSQFCAMWCQYPERFQREQSELPLVEAWLDTIVRDRGLEIVVGERSIRAIFQAVPRDADSLFNVLRSMLPEADETSWQRYCQSLILDLNGWAAAFAYRRWQRNLDAAEAPRYDEVTQLLLIRLIWEWVLWQFLLQREDDLSARLREQFQQQFAQDEQRFAAIKSAQQLMWVWQRALELSYQQPFIEQLQALQQQAKPSQRPSLQAAFCIDVRSEPMRRALEAQDENIQTLGFAGFFGLPIAVAQGEHHERAQLPGLLAPQLLAKQDIDSATFQRFQRDVSWHRAHDAPAGAFGWVELSGLAKAWKMLLKHLRPEGQARVGDQILHPGKWRLEKNGETLNSAQLAELAAGILKAMGLFENFAQAVLLAGHGSCTENNPHAAGLDCGACGGQTGSANVRILAQLLNDTDVRTELAQQHGIEIPSDTRFYPAMHNTTTEQLELLEGREQAAQLHWYPWLAAATAAAAAEHIERLPAANSAADILKRAGDWAQVRPEWGLVRNAGVIFAPRQLIKSLNLEGRVFLHDYTHQYDEDSSILTLLMTAPMVVTQWINMQYMASMVAPRHFGSGNKLLHNVVADGLGVFEGNAGDLRIGLPLQSIHDGKDWYHQPLRLSVVIAAPQEKIDAIIAAQPVVADLVFNGWLHLLQWNPETGAIARRTGRGWEPWQQ